MTHQTVSEHGEAEPIACLGQTNRRTPTDGSEPEASLYPDLLALLVRLAVGASEFLQIWVNIHSMTLEDVITEISETQSLNHDVTNRSSLITVQIASQLKNERID